MFPCGTASEVLWPVWIIKRVETNNDIKPDKVLSFQGDGGLKIYLFCIWDE